MYDKMVFIVDLNEVESDGLIPVSIDFTVNFGPFVSTGSNMPALNSIVRLHSDDDDTLYYGTVVEVLDDRDFLARIDWDSCAPVLNSDWSAHVQGPVGNETSTAGYGMDVNGVAYDG